MFRCELHGYKDKACCAMCERVPQTNSLRRAIKATEKEWKEAIAKWLKGTQHK